MVQISKRLQAVAALVEKNGTLADVGCDHGYIPIYLVKEQKVASAIAMDVNPGPLERAREHIQQYGMSDRIQMRLSDGVRALKPKEASTVVIAGMGGGLVRKILTEGADVMQTVEEAVLQPQSEIDVVRSFLTEEGYVVTKEDMILEDGKYYPMMRVVHADSAEGKEKALQIQEQLETLEKQFGDVGRDKIIEVWNCYGRELLLQRHPVLIRFLKREREQYLQIEAQLKRQIQTEKIQKRIEDVAAKLEIQDLAFRILDR